MAQTRVPPTTKEILAKQARDAKERREAKPPPPSTAVATVKPTAIAVPDNRTPREKYLDEIAPAGIVGRMIKFTKDGEFATADDDTVIDENADFTVLADQTLIGCQRFHDDAPPDRRMGLLMAPLLGLLAARCRAYPILVVPEMLAQRAVRTARNADGGAALTPRHFAFRAFASARKLSPRS
jgi:hypothetical protein